MASTVADHLLVHLVIIWLYLTLLMDVGSSLLIAQDYEPLSAFDNPIFTSTSPRNFWGRKWNMQVSTSFKRCVFKPLMKSKLVPPTLAGILTFTSSGLFHEYQFVLSFPTYTFGRISSFFVLQGLVCGLDNIATRAFGKSAFGSAFVALPDAVKAFIVVGIMSPTVPIFSRIWIDAGMFNMIASMVPLVSIVE
uniref:Wax synthase domain-containing protein n=1 Tax=Haptolina brevifila TaxID=156173 RepID=A0A7S2HIZ1_9EUKA|mmetsp:Transcript_55190/g.109592  ORF Transcript_55190/g.109592 Transcript_55190/m.109592 type:complete len:193 (+) Transcript_55190:197-775(+)